MSQCLSVCLSMCIDSPVTEVHPSDTVIQVGDEFELRCSVQFGAATNSSLTRQQFPRLTLNVDDVPLTDTELHYTEGQPGNTPHSLAKVLLVALAVAVSETTGDRTIFTIEHE